MSTHNASIEVYYRPEVALPEGSTGNFSKTPTKPRRFVQHLAQTPLAPHIVVQAGFEPVTQADLLLAHEARYVSGFLAGRTPHANSNGLQWSRAFAESVLYTSGSLLAAVRGCLDNPAQVTHSPTGGFHHALPFAGNGFCTFSGQVIAALRVYRERGAVGAWIDLDCHYGNSIEDARAFTPDLNRAIPEGFNVNPMGEGQAYLRNLARGLDKVGDAVLRGEVQYVAFAHGADSHEWDDLGGQCSTEQWVAASSMVYSAVADWSRQLGRPVPLTTALFGGYRDDDPASVLNLHATDLAVALRELGGALVDFIPAVVKPARRGGR